MNNNKAQERVIEKQVAAMKRQMDLLAPRPKSSLAPQFMDAYTRDLPRRLGLERSFEISRRNLNALRLMPAFEPAPVPA